jgi:hypothetical protein
MKWSLALSDKGSKPVSNYPPGLPNGPPDPIEPSDRHYDRAIETVLERIAESTEGTNEMLAVERIRQLVREVSWPEITEVAYEYAASPPDVDEDVPYDEERVSNHLTNGG